jgi:hypothetical protein
MQVTYSTFYLLEILLIHITQSLLLETASFELFLKNRTFQNRLKRYLTYRILYNHKK